VQEAPAFCTRATGSKFPWEEMAMAKITGLCVGESLVGEGNEVAHIDLIMGRAAALPRPHSRTAS